MPSDRRRTAAAAICLVAFVCAPVAADELVCDLAGYQAQPGLDATLADDILQLVSSGAFEREVRLDLSLQNGTPTIDLLAVRRADGMWSTIITNVQPEFRIVSGLRRITEQQLRPLRDLDVELSSAIVDTHKWDAFWDAPLDLDQAEPARRGNPPPVGGVAHQPGLPHALDEVERATATHDADRCTVSTDGARVEVDFPGMTLRGFSGGLRFTVYRGTNLVRVEAVVVTEAPSVAYKYAAGLRGLPVGDGSRVVWRDLTNQKHAYDFGGAPNDDPVILKVNNRIVVAQTDGGSLAAFPPPHTLLLRARGGDESRLRLVSERPGRHVRFRCPPGRSRRRDALPGELLSLQCETGIVTTYAGVSLCERRAREHAGVRWRAGFHARRPLSARPRPPGHGEPFPYEPG